MGKREERRAKRQQEAIEHATTLFAEGGYGNLTMSTLAERMGASVGGLYRYYGSKAELIVALQQRALDHFLEHMMTCTQQADDPWHRVIAAAQSWGSFRLESPIAFRLLNDALSGAERQLDDEQAGRVDEKVSAVLEVLVKELQAAVAAGLLSEGPAMVRAYTLWAALHGLEQLRKRDTLKPKELQVDALTQALLADLRRAWSA